MRLKLKYPQKFKKQHKKRNSFKLKKNTFNNNLSRIYAIILTQRYTLPKTFISFFRKNFRKFFKNKKIKLYFSTYLNTCISSKSKNARMGKGTGSINRYAYTISEQKPILICLNISYKRISLINKHLRKRIGVHSTIIKL